jgi:DNA-3-methyladenine glycosylase II
LAAAPRRPTRSELAALARRDPALGNAMRLVPPFPGFPGPDQARLSNWAYLARSIVYQQLAARAAATIFGRVQRLGGRRFPTPEQFLALDDADLRAAGLSRSKMMALRSLAEHIESGELRLTALARRSDEDIVAELVRVRGIGPWTAQMFLLFKLGRLDVLPITDLGVQEGLRRVDGLEERPAPTHVAARGAVWSPLSSVAVWVLWRVLELPPDGLQIERGPLR